MKFPPLVERELRATARRPVFYWLRALIVVVAALKGVELFDRYSSSIVAPPRWTTTAVPPGVMVMSPGALGANYSFALGGVASVNPTGPNTSNQFSVPSVVPLAAPSNVLTLIPGGGVTNATVTMVATGPPLVKAAPRTVGPALLKELGGVAFLIALGMGLLTADSISREKREGTLGLLILSNLSTRQIVAGKLAAHGLTGFTALLAFVPVSMIALLAGGVTFAQAFLTAIGLLSVLFVSLTGGLLVSALFRERWQVYFVALLLIGFLAQGAGILIEGFAGVFTGFSFDGISNFIGLAGWKAAGGTVVERVFIFLPWFGAVNLMGMGLFHLAAWALRRRWQESPHKHVRDLERIEASEQAGWVLGEDVEDVFARPSLLSDPRPWDASPIRWRMERLGSAESFVWVPMLISFLAQFGLLGAISSHGSGDVEMLRLLASAGLLSTLGAGAFLAWVGARFFLNARSQQDLEMLLTTEVGGREILSGQWSVLRRAMAGPCAVLAVISLPATVVVVAGLFRVDTRTIEYLLPLVLMALNLVMETLAIFWVAMWFGLTARNAPVALCGTVVLVLLAPMAGVFGVVAAWQWIAIGGPVEFPVVGFLLFKNGALILWARRRLWRELRLGRRRKRDKKTTPQLLPQPA